MTYKGSNWTRGDLGNVPDRNPSIECPECGAAHDYHDYWKARYVEGMDWNPAEMYWLCDACLNEMYREYETIRRGREHKQLTAW